MLLPSYIVYSKKCEMLDLFLYVLVVVRIIGFLMALYAKMVIHL